MERERLCEVISNTVSRVHGTTDTTNILASIRQEFNFGSVGIKESDVNVMYLAFQMAILDKLDEIAEKLSSTDVKDIKGDVETEDSKKTPKKK